MKPDKYITLPMAKRIVKAAKAKGIELPESEYGWYKWRNTQIQQKEINTIEMIIPHEGDYDYYEFIVPAYDLHELLKYLIWIARDSYVDEDGHKVHPNGDIHLEHLYGGWHAMNCLMMCDDDVDCPGGGHCSSGHGKTPLAALSNLLLWYIKYHPEFFNDDKK